MATAKSKRLVVCIDNDGYPAALERRKIYVVIPDAVAEKRRLVRVIDSPGTIISIQRRCSARSRCRSR